MEVGGSVCEVWDVFSFFGCVGQNPWCVLIFLYLVSHATCPTHHISSSAYVCASSRPPSPEFIEACLRFFVCFVCDLDRDQLVSRVHSSSSC